MFQPRSRTSLSLGSVTNVTSYLSPPHHFNCFLGLSPLPSAYLPPPPTATLKLSYTALFTPNFHPYISVLYRLSTWTIVHSHRPTPPVPELYVLPLSTCPPGTSHTLHPHPSSPFLLPPPPSVCPLSPPLTFLASLSTPLGAPF